MTRDIRGVLKIVCWAEGDRTASFVVDYSPGWRANQLTCTSLSSGFRAIRLYGERYSKIPTNTAWKPKHSPSREHVAVSCPPSHFSPATKTLTPSSSTLHPLTVNNTTTLEHHVEDALHQLRRFVHRAELSSSTYTRNHTLHTLQRRLRIWPHGTFLPGEFQHDS
jgi:hypothetical protein